LNIAANIEKVCYVLKVCYYLCPCNIVKYMKRRYFFRAGGLIILFILLSLSSCRKDELNNYDYFEAKELKLSYSEETIAGLLDIVAASFPEIASVKSFVGSGVTVYRVTYNTTVEGYDIIASGLVCIPSEPGSYPLFSFQNGTNTVNAYAPTEYVTNPSLQMIQFIASMGFVVVIPDYPGFGESDDIPHPYLIKESTVASVIDLLRAVREGGPAEFDGVSITDEVYLAGYSQGGWATLAVHYALEKEYNSEFSLKGSVCGAGPYDLSGLFLSMVGQAEYPMPSYLGYIINAYSEYKQFVIPVNDVLNEPYASRLPGLFNGNLTLEQINNQLTTSIQGLLRQEFLDGFGDSPAFSSVREALVLNSIQSWRTEKPLYLIHGDGDTHVNVSTTITMYDAMIASGTSENVCRKMIIPGLDHGDSVVPALIEGIGFLIDILESSER